MSERCSSGYKLLSEKAEAKKMSVCNFVLSVFREYLTCDLYLREYMKNRPSFCSSLEHWKNDIHDILHKESEEHILFPFMTDCNYRELTKILHVEVFEYIFDRPTALIFCYERRSPLTRNGSVQYVTMEDF